jgi:hypothetical protein
MNNWEKVKIFLMGMLVAIGMMLLMAAGGNNGEIGRYEISSWGAARGFGVFVVDTKTGVTKSAYSTESLTASYSNLGKPFDEFIGR